MVRIVPVIVLLAVFPWVTSAQDATAESAPLLSQAEDIPPEYEGAIRDLVDRYEELRRLYRQELQRNTDLYTQAELDAAVAEVEDRLNGELEAAQQQVSEMEDRFKALQVALKNAQDEAQAFKEDLSKTRRDYRADVADLRLSLDSIEEESLFQVGATFSPAGSLGAVGIVNLPDTNVSLLAGADYLLRDRELNARFGVTLSFLPRQQLIDGWQRLRARFGNRVEEKAMLAE